jgi:hypothetical protein
MDKRRLNPKKPRQSNTPQGWERILRARTLPSQKNRRLCGIKKQAIFDELSGATVNEKFRGCGSSKNPRL